VKALTCAVCKKTVDRITQWHDVASQCEVFKAECHGQIEIASLAVLDIMTSRPGGIEFAEAFKSKAIA
jgi:hypothetical protein